MLSNWRVVLLVAVLSVVRKAEESPIIEILNQTRLINANGEIGAGRIEVFHDGQWGTICDEDWNLESANVVCKELGFRHALLPSMRAYFGQGTGPVWLSNVNCSGSEQSIHECSHAGWGVQGATCKNHATDAGVRCTSKDVPMMNYMGCYVDNPGNRSFSDLYSNRRSYINWRNLGETVMQCAKDAIDSEKIYNLFAVQHYGECWAQEGKPVYDKMKTTELGCPAGVGSMSHNAVYIFGDYYDLGCWQDKGWRTMNFLEDLRLQIDWLDLDATVSACYTLAKKAGFKYFAIQFYGECWVSNDDEKYKSYGYSTNCYIGVGSHWTNYVYKIRS